MALLYNASTTTSTAEEEAKGEAEALEAHNVGRYRKRPSQEMIKGR